MLPLYDNIRRRRIELNMSQQELADKLGYTSRTTIAKIEAGKIDIPQSKVEAFAKVLDISPGTLMGWTDSKNKALWRYTLIENDHITRKYPRPVDGESGTAFSSQGDSPLLTDTSSDFLYTLTSHETDVINAYRDKPEMQPAVDTLLGVAGDSNCKTIKVAAYGGGIKELELHADDDTIDIELKEDSSI